LKKIRTFLFSNLIYIVFRLLRATWKIDVDPVPSVVQRELAEGKLQIVAHFHEDEWALIGFYAGKGMHSLVSLSEDGGVMTAFMEKAGFNVSRGSSSRGAVGGLLSLIRSVKNSSSRLISVAVDGPKGPRRRSKNGVFKISESLNSPIVAVAAWSSSAWVFKKSWSKAFIPKPFARVRIRILTYLSVEEVKKAVNRDDYAELCFKLEDALKNAKTLAKNDIKNHT